jgi:hypothetical protein
VTREDLYTAILDAAEVWLPKAIDSELTGQTWRSTDQKLADLLKLAISLRRVDQSVLRKIPPKDPPMLKDPPLNRNPCPTGKIPIREREDT